MKRNILAIIICAVIIAGAYGQNTDQIDLVLVLDTSVQMSSSYENVTNYITGQFLKEYLKTGDTFHLIPFSASPRLDVARRISGIGDVETIIGRMLLQYPIEIGSNVSAALTYALQYVTALPNRSKKIVLVTLGSSNTNTVVSGARQRLARNTTLDFVPVTAGQPLTNLPVSGRSDTSRDVSQETSRDASQETSRDISQVVSQTNQEGVITTETGSTEETQTGEFAAETDHADTETEQSEEKEIDETETEETEETAAAEGQYRETQTNRETRQSDGLSLPVIIGIIILILLILGLLIYLLSRRLSSSPNRVMSQVSSGSASKTEPKEKAAKKEASPEVTSYAATTRRTTPYDDRNPKIESGKPVVINPSGPLMLNLFVEDQNTCIGKRNVHSLKSGYNLTVGGGKSDDFQIFLVPIPSHIGEIRRSGSKLSFVPGKAKYFPDNGTKEVSDCLNKTIRIVSDKNYEIRFRFEMYEDPLVSLNRLLNSVKVPG
ncbi:MAG: VWA domain-containing protein [Treponema sp.]|nr:VWA domain-containing protein [Treponema sp.]